MTPSTSNAIHLPVITTSTTPAPFCRNSAASDVSAGSAAAGTMTVTHRAHEPTSSDLPARRDRSLPLEEEGDGEEENDDGATSLVTTAAATWCLHAVASRNNTDALLAAFKQLLRTHHTLHEPAPPLLAELPSRLWRSLKVGRAPANEEQYEHADESNFKREDTQATAAAATDGSQSWQAQQQATTGASSRGVGGETAAPAPVWTSATPSSQKESVMSAAVATAEDENEDVIPAFPVYEAILQSDWKDERAKREKTGKKKRGKARVTSDTVASPGQQPGPVCPEDTCTHLSFSTSHLQSHAPGNRLSQPTSAHEDSSIECTVKPFLEAEDGQQRRLQHDLACADKTIPATSTAAATQWSFTFSCRSCGRSDTIEEKSACCRACLLAQNTSQTQSGVQHATENSSPPETGCTVCGRERETLQGRSAAYASTNSTCNNSSSTNRPDTEEVHGDDKEPFCEDLLLPPAVPVSSALKRISPEAVHLWNLRAKRGKGVNKTAHVVGEVSLSHGVTTGKRHDGEMYCNHTDTTHISGELIDSQVTAQSSEEAVHTEDSDYTNGREVFDLLRVVQPRKSSAERRKETQENDIHVRAQLACLVEADETKARYAVIKNFQNEDELAEEGPCNGTAERPEARKLTAAVLGALKKLPQRERGEEAFLELLLSWYYAGFFTGRLSMCSNGDKPA